MTDEVKLLKKLLIFAGWTQQMPSPWRPVVATWVDPEGNEVWCGLPDLLGSVDALFKEVVPKLTRYELWCDVVWDGEKKAQGERHFALAQLGEQTEVEEAETPAMALALAIGKLVGS